MIVVDTSALVAILLQEERAADVAAALAAAPSRQISAANWLETSIVIEAKKGEAGALEFDALMERAAIEIAPDTPEIVRAARLGYRYYGKGRHQASLNFGDCFAYGLAKVKGLPLLAVGADFARTDIALVL